MFGISLKKQEAISYGWKIKKRYVHPENKGNSFFASGVFERDVLRRVAVLCGYVARQTVDGPVVETVDCWLSLVNEVCSLQKKKKKVQAHVVFLDLYTIVATFNHHLRINSVFTNANAIFTMSEHHVNNDISIYTVKQKCSDIQIKQH